MTELELKKQTTQRRPLGLLTFDRETGRLAGATDSACQILQISRGELLGGSPLLDDMLNIPVPISIQDQDYSARITVAGRNAIDVVLGFQALDTDAKSQILVLFQALENKPQRPETDPRFLLEAFEAADDLVALIDPETLRILHVNQGAARALGYKKAELLERTPLDFKPLITESQYRTSYVEPLLNGELTSVTFETIHRRKDGSEHPVEVLLQPMCDGFGPTILLNVARDLTERVVREQEQQRFFNIALQMLCIADANGYFLRVNSYFRKVLGYPEELLLSHPYEEFVHPEDVESTREATARLLEGERLVGFENRYRHLDGSYRTLQWTALQDPVSGHLYAAAMDVTEERRREAELFETNRRLETQGRFDRAARRILIIFNQRTELEVALADVSKAMEEELNLENVGFCLLDEWSSPVSHVNGSASSPPQTGQELVEQVLQAHSPGLRSDGPACTNFAIPLFHRKRMLPCSPVPRRRDSMTCSNSGCSA